MDTVETSYVKPESLSDYEETLCQTGTERSRKVKTLSFQEEHLNSLALFGYL